MGVAWAQPGEGARAARNGKLGTVLEQSGEEGGGALRERLRRRVPREVASSGGCLGAIPLGLRGIANPGPPKGGRAQALRLRAGVKG